MNTTQTNWTKHTRKRGMNSREKQLLTALQDIAAIAVGSNDAQARAEIISISLKAIGVLK